EAGQRQPDPQQLTNEDAQPPFTEKGHADRRDLDRLPGEEITACVERGEKSNPQPAVGEAVEDAVRSGDEEKIAPQVPPRLRERRAACQSDGQAREQGTEQRVEKSPVAEEGTIRDAERKRQDVQIRRRGQAHRQTAKKGRG